jgi:preprotein translocase subunit YajC
MLIRPQNKKQKAHQELVAALKSGDEVMTAGGILGVIKDVTDHYVAVEIADNTVIKMQKASVSQVVPKGTVDAA